MEWMRGEVPEGWVGSWMWMLTDAWQVGVGGCGRVWAWVGVTDSPRCVFPSSWMVLHVLFCRGEEPAELVSRPPSGRRHEARRPSQGDHHTGPQHHYHHYQHHNTLWGHYAAAATATATAAATAFCCYRFTDPLLATPHQQ
ncbi:hypothetical protein E2C01_082619 [Portunus trituberculatus]|uniref:Uncharacterized protein n=1 Tax=Portunus trituberculatus TaxID=210409 RepID=A0A5B7J1B5_PORTR|nr:hypothetical protein [Portunus trituberculatus]